jgi:hypothetical protein
LNAASRDAPYELEGPLRASRHSRRDLLRKVGHGVWHPRPTPATFFRPKKFFLTPFPFVYAREEHSAMIDTGNPIIRGLVQRGFRISLHTCLSEGRARTTVTAKHSQTG